MSPGALNVTFVAALVLISSALTEASLIMIFPEEVSRVIDPGASSDTLAAALFSIFKNVEALSLRTTLPPPASSTMFAAAERVNPPELIVPIFPSSIRRFDAEPSKIFPFTSSSTVGLDTPTPTLPLVSSITKVFAPNVSPFGTAADDALNVIV